MKTTIAITDDHALMRQALTEHLGRHFEVIITAFNGNDLLEKIKLSGTVPDVVTLPVSLHGMDGFETTKKLKRIYPQIKIVVFSYNGDAHVIRKMLQCGADKYILKAEIGQLITAIREVVEIEMDLV
jgi:DNA-binding NarL/FixJ family response regulator